MPFLLEHVASIASAKAIGTYVSSFVYNTRLVPSANPEMWSELHLLEHGYTTFHNRRLPKEWQA